VLSPLQLLLVGIIGGLFGRPVEVSTVYEYLAAIDILGATGFGLRMAVEQLVKTVPISGVGPAALGLGTEQLLGIADPFALLALAEKVSPSLLLNYRLAYE